MVTSYDKGLDLYCKDITNHYHCKVSPYIQPSDHKIHDNLHIFMSFSCHDKAAPIITSLAPCQIDLQKNLEECFHENL